MKTGNKPGLTRSLQWVRTGKTGNFSILPAFSGQNWKTRMLLCAWRWLAPSAKTPAPEEDSGWYLLNWLIQNHPRVFSQRYQVEHLPEYPEELLEMVARNRGMVRKGGIRETETYIMLLKEFRDGKLGSL